MSLASHLCLYLGHTLVRHGVGSSTTTVIWAQTLVCTRCGGHFPIAWEVES